MPTGLSSVPFKAKSPSSSCSLIAPMYIVPPDTHKSFHGNSELPKFLLRVFGIILPEVTLPSESRLNFALVIVKGLVPATTSPLTTDKPSELKAIDPSVEVAPFANTLIALSVPIRMPGPTLRDFLSLRLFSKTASPPTFKSPDPPDASDPTVTLPVPAATENLATP